MNQPVANRFVRFLKLLIPAVILGWLLWKEGDALQDLFTRPKDLPRMAISFACLLTAVLLSFVRWFLLVRALDIPFRLREAVRLGFLGYLFNFVGPGSVGGDLFKAYFVAKEQKERKAEAVATIFLDRLVGMFSLFCVATCAILFLGSRRNELAGLGDFLQLVVWLTFLGAAGVVLLLLPRHFSDWLLVPMTRLPWIGTIVLRVRGALELYRKRRAWLLLIGLFGLTIHCLLAVTIHFIDRSLHPIVPTLGEHLVISPLASVASAAPVPGGLGTYEFALDYLFGHLPAAETEPGQGLRIAVIYRLMTILIAGIGAVFYSLNRFEVAEAVAVLETEHDENDRQDSRT